MLPSLSIVLKRIMSLCSAVVIAVWKHCNIKNDPFCCWWIFGLLPSFVFTFPWCCTCLLVYTVKSFSKVYPGVSHRLCMSSTLAENGKLFFKQTVLIYTPISCVPPSLANTVRSPPHQSAPIWLPVIVSLCGFSFLISWWWMTLSTFSYICWPFGFRLFKSLVFILKSLF